MDLRDFLKVDRSIRREVDPKFEIARYIFENQDKTLLFNNVRGSDFKIAGNIIPTRERMCEALNATRDGFISKVTKALKNPVKPVILGGSGECQEVTEKSLFDIPVLSHFENDAGPYITSGIVVAKDDEGTRNVSFHRMLVLDDKRLAIRLVERHLHQYYTSKEKKNEPLDVAVLVGLHPAILFAGAYSLPIEKDEFELASAFIGGPLELVRGKSTDIEVPRYAELVIEGQLLPYEREDEGPFTDITGTYDIVRKQPVLKVKRITHRKNPIYHALVPSSGEHRIFMGMPQEPRIYNSVNKSVKVKNVCLTEGGYNWLHGVVSIKKVKEEDGRKAVEAAIKGHPSMKHVVIVDEDIDIFDTASVESAIATRFQAERDLFMFKNARGSSLDPSTGKSLMTTKLGLDATKPLDRREKFERAKIP